MTQETADLSAAYRGARVLVLGASGFIGRWVARRLTESGANIVVAVRDREAFARIAAGWSIRAEVRAFDAMDRTSSGNLFNEVLPDFVFNAIGYGVDRAESDPATMWSINRDLVRQVALACSQLPASDSTSRDRRFIHVGSALEYGLLEGIATEARHTDPHTLYGQSKLAGTNALADVARETGLKAVTARAFTVFGPGEHPGRLLPTLRRAAIENTSVRLSAGTQRRDFSYVEDVADGLLRLGISPVPPGGAVNLASGRMTLVREFAETAARVLDIPADRLQFGAEPVRDDEMRITGVDVGRLEAWTGWTPPADLESALARAADFEARLTR